MQSRNDLKTIIQNEVNNLDPMGIFPGERCPIDEYNLEVEMIFSELQSIKTPQELSNKIKDIFNSQFDEDFSAEKFYKISETIFNELKGKR